MWDRKSTKMEPDHYKMTWKRSKRNKYTKKRKRAGNLPGCDIIPIEIHRKLISTNRYTTEKTGKTKRVDMDRRAYESIQRLKFRITQLPCLAHYNSKNDNILTTDASIKELGGTLCQKEKDGYSKPFGFASRFSSDTEKKYGINELELLAVEWGLERVRLYNYGKPIKLLTDHQAL